MQVEYLTVQTVSIVLELTLCLINIQYILHRIKTILNFYGLIGY